MEFALTRATQTSCNVSVSLSDRDGGKSLILVRGRSVVNRVLIKNFR